LSARSCSASSRLMTAHSASWPGDIRGVRLRLLIVCILPPSTAGGAAPRAEVQVVATCERWSPDHFKDAGGLSCAQPACAPLFVLAQPACAQERCSAPRMGVRSEGAGGAGLRPSGCAPYLSQRGIRVCPLACALKGAEFPEWGSSALSAHRAPGRRGASRSRTRRAWRAGRSVDPIDRRSARERGRTQMCAAHRRPGQPPRRGFAT
jgi:hypothetical protein